MPRTDAGVPVNPWTTSTPTGEPATWDHASHPAITSAVDVPLFIPAFLPAAGRTGSADLVLQLGMVGGDHGDEGVDHVRIELPGAAGGHELGGLDARPAALVRAPAAERVIDVGHADDPARQRDRVVGDAERVTAAVPPLVMRLCDLGRHLEHRRRVPGEDAVPHARVGLHHLVLLD